MRKLLACLAALLFTAGTHAAWPERPIRFMIPSGAGSSVDVLMRILTAEMSRSMGVAFVVENKPGASFTIGTLDIVRAAQK